MMLSHSGNKNRLFLSYIILCVQYLVIGSFTFHHKIRMSSVLSSNFGENNFGDIMGGCETSVTIAGSFTPMERVVLSANGNLQRIMSAYYDAPVLVQVIKSEPRGITDFEREVNLMMDNKVFCTAIGQIELYSDECIIAIAEKNVGVGQLFRYFGVLPSFNLISAGRNDDGALWREYELSCPQLKCSFVETFAPGFLDFKVQSVSQPKPAEIYVDKEPK